MAAVRGDDDKDLGSLWFKRFLFEIYVTILPGARATRQRSWLRHYATSRKVAGCSQDEVDFYN
jgi:hypothetical protein